MKKITILFAFCAVALGVSAQTTFDLDWEQGVNGSAASFTIETGDTVRWTWSNGAPHDVVSNDPDAPGDFGSEVVTGEGNVYEFTFTDVAIIDYLCSIHPGSMFGTITVEEALSVDDKFAKNITFYPNPVENTMRIVSLYKFDNYEIYNMAGKKVGGGLGEGTNTDLDASYLTQGVYFVRIVDGDLEATLKMIKK